MCIKQYQYQFRYLLDGMDGKIVFEGGGTERKKERKKGSEFSGRKKASKQASENLKRALVD